MLFVRSVAISSERYWVFRKVYPFMTVMTEMTLSLPHLLVDSF